MIERVVIANPDPFQFAVAERHVPVDGSLGMACEPADRDHRHHGGRCGQHRGKSRPPLPAKPAAGRIREDPGA